MSARGDLATQFELTNLHWHHDGVPAPLTRFFRQWRQVSGNEHLGVASRAGNHLERLIVRTHTDRIVTFIGAATSAHNRFQARHSEWHWTIVGCRNGECQGSRNSGQTLVFSLRSFAASMVDSAAPWAPFRSQINHANIPWATRARSSAVAYNVSVANNTQPPTVNGTSSVRNGWYIFRKTPITIFPPSSGRIGNRLKTARFTFKRTENWRSLTKLNPTCSPPAATIPTMPERCSGCLKSNRIAVPICVAICQICSSGR